MSILETGIVEKTFLKYLNVSETAKAMMSQLRGSSIKGGAIPQKMDRMVQHIALQTEYWVRKATMRKTHSE